MKKCSGSISIYFVFAIILIISVVLSVTEIARINCQKLYLQIATDAGLDSMASLYHRKLYEFYNLYGVEYRTLDLLKSEYMGYIYPYLKSEERNITNWYTALLGEENIDLKIKQVTDEYNFEKEVLSYTKYKIIGKAIKFLGKEILVDNENDLNKLVDESKDLFDQVEESSLYSEVHERYFNFSKHIKILEDNAKKIVSYIDKVNISLKNIANISTGGSETNASNVLKKFDDLYDKITNLKSYLVTYKDKMNEFREIVNESYENYLYDKEHNIYEFNDDINEFVESEFENFINFVDENSEMNLALESGYNACNEMLKNVSSDYKEIKEYVNEFDNIEDELKEARKEKGEDRDKDLIKALEDELKSLSKDFSEYLKSLREDYKYYKMEHINIITSVDTDSKNSNLLSKLVGFKNGLLISFILDNEEISHISKEVLNFKKFSILSNVGAISVGKILLGEYTLDKFNYYNKDKFSKITNSNSKKLEVERIISGKTNDLDAINNVINQIFVIRIAMNVLHIYKSNEKRQLARASMGAIFSGLSPLMVEAMFILLITGWGIAQSIVDLQNLMNGNRVKFFHDDSSWTVSVNSILSFAENKISMGETSNDDGFALNYEDYLRLLLIKTKQSDANERMVQIIDYNLKEVQESFDFEKLVYSFEVNNSFICKHFFTNFTFIQAENVNLSDKYRLTINGFRSFYDHDK